MRKQIRQYLRRSLCGILSAAMILTGSSISGMTAYASQPDVEEAGQTNDVDDSVDVTPSEENKDAVQNPDAGGDTGDGNENGAGDIDSGNEDGDTQKQPDDSSEGDDAMSPDENTNPDGEENDGDSADDVTEDDGITDDDSADDDSVDDAAGEEDLEDASDEKGVLGAEDGAYESVPVELNFYVGELNADETVGFYYWTSTGGAVVIDTDTNPLLTWGGWEKPDENPVYEMLPVDGHTGWYHITPTVTDKLTLEAGVCTGSLVGFSVFKSSDPNTELIKCDGWNNPEIYTGLLAGEITAVKEGAGYASIDEAEAATTVSKEALAELVAEAKKLKEEDYKAAGWTVFSDALTAADEVLAKEAPASSEIEEAYDNLEKAMKALVPNSTVDAEINVKPVALTDDFILGADISSYYALKQSGTVFKDENGNELDDAGFFQYLHDGGTNWIRIRVWNDPYDSEGHGYGGGNNDLDKAKIMGKLATDAGMRVLIDFHYSDFWADPGKQQAPKAWAGMSVDEKAEAVYQFTKDGLSDLKAAGVDVGMVQIGNETTQGICGVKYSDSNGWESAAKIYNAGSRAVKEIDANCLVAVHFTNPEKTSVIQGLAKSLDDQQVDYDVFATSYYPFWHGTTENLTSVLAHVAKTYGKKVMVAETSWATTLDDQDGHENTVRKGNNDSNQPYAFSVQGQADEIRAVVEAVNNVNSVEGAAGSSIGVFYWESAWLSPHYVYNEDGTKNEELYAQNKALWEEHGSGWASSYGGEYDPNDAGKWFGGSAVDNQAWFGFDGTALATAKVYSYIRTGATAEKAVSDVVNPSVTINAGGTVEYPEKVTVNFNDGSSAEYAVTWKAEDQAKVDTTIPGEYKVKGIVTCEYTLNDGSPATATKDVTFTITVKPVTVPEFINPGFEDADMSAWAITGAGTARTKDDPHGGTYGVHFYNGSAVTSTVMQTIKDLDAGTYIFGGYIQGDATGTTAKAVVKVYDSEGTLKDTKTAPAATTGWAIWQNPEISGIVVGEGDYLEVGMEINAVAGGWGSIDDFYLYASAYGIVLDDQNKNGTLSGSAAQASAGETITITATPKADYILTKLTLSGKSVKSDTLTSTHGTVTYDEDTKTAVLTYADKISAATEESFIMPNSMVKVSAVFRTDVDLSALDQLIAEYEKVIFDGYTEDSWQTFTDALEAAQTAAENVDATQEEIDNARTALETAYNGLTKAAAATPEEIAALSALIATYEKITNDGYTEESWKNFTDALAAAKAAVEKENATTTDIARATKALEKAHKELVKESTGEVDLTALNALIAQCDSVTNDGYTEESWNTFTDALAAAKEAAAKENVTQAEIDSVKAALEAAYAGLKRAEHHEGLWFEILKNPETADGSYIYTGAAIKPEIRVYHGDELLQLKKDYTVAYKNNTNAGEATVTVTGKGNFKGKDTAVFTIHKKNINDADITAADVYAILKANGTVVNPKVTVKFGKKTLKNNNDYKVIYPDFEKDADGKIAAKDYQITISTTAVKKKNGEDVDSANYTGSRIIDYTVRENGTLLMSSARITLDKTKVDYAGDSTEKPRVTGVKIGSTTLTQDDDYTVTYDGNWNRTGKAAVIVTAKEGTKYYGSKTVSYTVNGTKLAAKELQIEGIEAGGYDYTGEPVFISEEAADPAMRTLKVTRIKAGGRPIEGGTILVEGTDYTVSYKTGRKAGEHTNAGTVTVTITGINAYTGSVSRTFKIKPVDLAALGTKEAPAGLTFAAEETAKYNKTGAKPAITRLTYNGRPLVEKQDYTVTYQKNNTVTAGDTSAVMMIKGKGNFKGSYKHSYKVTAASAEDVYAAAADIVKPVKFNQVKTAVKVFETETGKALKAGTDYEKTITYHSDPACTEASAITAENFAAAADIDQVIYAKVTMRGNYAGTGETPGVVTAAFRVYDKDLKMTSKKLEIKVDTTTDREDNPIACDGSRAKNPYYTGADIEPKVTVTLKGSGGAADQVLTEGTDYAVAYSNNRNKGKATVTVTGTGNGCGGTKNLKFTIVSKDMKWYEEVSEKIASFFSNLF